MVAANSLFRQSPVLSLVVLPCHYLSMSGTDYESEGRRFESRRARFQSLFFREEYDQTGLTVRIVLPTCCRMENRVVTSIQKGML
jgi:hypothetical protein